jgi:autotransporter family porin
MSKHASSQQAPSHQRIIVQAVAAACLGFTATSAVAASSCTGSGAPQTVSGADTSTCVLVNGDSVTVTGTGSIGTLAAPLATVAGIHASGVKTIGSITNQGSIVTTGAGDVFGIDIEDRAAVSGGITNSGTISATSSNFAVGINLFTSNVVAGTITNSGSISAKATGGGESIGILFSSTSSAHAIVNSGTISASATAGEARGIGIESGSSVAAGITNQSGGVISATATSGRAIGIAVTNSTVAGGITNAGTISATSTGGSGYGILVGPPSVVSGITNSGTIKGTALSLNLLNTGSPFVVNNSGILNGNVALGINTLALTGSSGQVIGNVTGGVGSSVNVGGTFTAGGDFTVASFSVSSSGVFNVNGSQTINSTNAISNAGVFAVGAGSNATVPGNYTQTAGGALGIGVSSATRYGILSVTGTADLSASPKINVIVTPGTALANGAVLTGVLQAGTLTGAGSITVTDNSPFLSFTAVEAGSEINLDVNASGSVRADVIAAGNTPAVGAATSLDSLISGMTTPSADMTAVLSGLSGLGDAREISRAVTQMLPLFNGDLDLAALAALRNANHIIEARTQSLMGLSSGDGIAGDRGVWLRPFGSWADQNDRAGVAGYTSHTYGLAIGADTALSNADRLGAAFFYSNIDVDNNPGGATQNAKIDSYEGTIYGSHQINAGGVSFQADLGHNDNEGHRNIDFGDINRTASSSYGSSTVHVGVGFDQAFSMGQNMAFIPSVRADYTTVNSDAYGESGAGGLDLRVGQTKAREFILAANGKWVYALNATSSLYANFGVGYDFLANRGSSVDALFVGGGPAFSTPGIEPKPVVIRAGVGYLVHTGGALEVAVRYDIEARDGFTNQTASVNMHLPF